MRDPELQPPDVEATEPMDARGGERRAVVGADRIRKPTGSEQPAEVRLHSIAADIIEALAAEEIAAEVVDDGQGIAVDAVAHPELALEIDRPDLVGSVGAQWSGARMLPGASAPAVVDVAVAGEDVEDRAARRPGALRVAGAKTLEDLAWAPAVAAVFLEDEGDDIGGGLVRDSAGRATSIEQSARPLVAEAIEPLVAGVAADAIAHAELGHGPMAAVEVLGEVVAFEHGVGLLPGHRLSSLTSRRSVNHVPGQLSSMYQGCTTLPTNNPLHLTAGVGSAKGFGFLLARHR